MPRAHPGSTGTSPGKDIVAVLHNIRSLHNIGSMFRTADAAGISKIYLTGFSGLPTDPKAAKVALGAERMVPWERYVRIGDLIRRLQKDGHQIVVLEQDSRSIPPYAFQPKFPIALIVGHEVRGVSATIRKRADAVIEIPQYGKKESLNVSVAFGIAVYALLRTKHQ